MKTAEIRDNLRRLSLNKFGFDANVIDQGSTEWSMMRLGVVTASNASKVIAPGRKSGTYGEARKTYMYDLIAEICAGQKKRTAGKSLEWGMEHEDDCISLLEFFFDIENAEKIPFVYGDETMRFGCSPDALIGDDFGAEVKNPHNSAVFLRFALEGEIKPEYIDQVQFSMFVTGRDYWYFGNHDPDIARYKFHAKVIERDESKISTFKDAVPQFLYEMDQNLGKIGYKFGDQWLDIVG